MDLHKTTIPFAADLLRPLTRREIELLERRGRRDRARAQADLVQALGRSIARLARRFNQWTPPARVAWR